MSLISEALKTAQQQRSQRVEHSGVNPFFDGFFPYAERARAAAPSRTLVIAGVAALVVAVAGGSIWFALSTRHTTVAPTPAKSVVPHTPVASVAPQQAGSPRPTTTDTKQAAVILAPPAAPVSHAAPRSVQPIPLTNRVAAKAPTQKPEASAPSAEPVAPPKPAVAPAPSATTVAPKSGIQISIDAAAESPGAALMTQAYAAQRAGDLDGAKSLYDRALGVGPGTPALYNNYGALLVARNEAQKAVPTLKLALQLDPSYVNAWINLGNAYEQLGDHPQAIGAYSQALRYDPENAATKSNLAQQYITVGALGDARRLLDEVVRATPNSPIVHFRLGELLEKQRDNAAAVREFTRFLELGGAPSQPGFDDRLKAHIVTLRSAP